MKIQLLAIWVLVGLIACAEHSPQDETKSADKVSASTTAEAKPLEKGTLEKKSKADNEEAVFARAKGEHISVVRADAAMAARDRSPILHEKFAAGQQRQINPTHSALQSREQLIRPGHAIALHDRSQPYYQQQYQNRENYQQRDDNPIKVVIEEPVSTFSIDVDTAAYSNIRRMLDKEGRLPPRNAVKAEEMINYFSYNYPQPTDRTQPFSVTTAMAPAPWNSDRVLLQIGLKGFEPEPGQRPAANLVFLVDVSGSMRAPDKLGLVKKSLRLLVNNMNAKDRIALVVYAGSAGLVLESTPAHQKATILNAIEGLEAGGSTNGGAGIQLAYATAQQHFIKGGINRVIIASDGDMNVGIVNHEDLKNLIEEKRKGGIALTTLGFGSGNYNDALMEQLADIGNGNAAYIDNLREANKVLVKEMQSTLMTIAKDVKIQIEFNRAIVAEYRLIGYQNRLLQREDFTNDKVDAGDIGAGHTVTALYELTLVDSHSKAIPPRRYTSTVEQSTSNNGELAFVKLRYKQPDAQDSTEISQAIYQADIKTGFTQAGNDLRFAAAVAGFSQLLRGGIHTGTWSYDDLVNVARQAKGTDPHGYRGEFISLVELASSLSQSTVALK